MLQVSTGLSIPLYVILDVADASKIVFCDIIEPRSGTLISEQLLLSPVIGLPGHYKNSSQIMPSHKNLIASFRVFESDEETLYSVDSENIVLLENVGGTTFMQSVTDLVGIIDDDAIVATVIVVKD